MTKYIGRQFDRRTGNSLQFDTVEKNSTYAPICLSNERLDDAMKTINPNLGANFTMFERAVDQQIKEHYQGVLPWSIDDYSPTEMQTLAQKFWAEQMETEL